MAIKAKKDQIAILRPLFEKTVKIRPLLIPNIPPIIYKKWPYFFHFLKFRLSNGNLAFLAFVAITRPKIGKMEKIRPLLLYNRGYV